jgi:hypothetical protein
MVVPRIGKSLKKGCHHFFHVFAHLRLQVAVSVLDNGGPGPTDAA